MLINGCAYSCMEQCSLNTVENPSSTGQGIIGFAKNRVCVACTVIFNPYHKHWTMQKLLHIWLTVHVLILDFKDGKILFSKIICHESLCTLFTSHSCTPDMPIRVVLSYVFFQATFSWQLSRNVHLWFQIVPRYITIHYCGHID